MIEPLWYNRLRVRTIKTLLAAWIGLCLVPGANAQTSGLNVTAQGAIIIDAESGKVLWSKDADTMRFPASTTKIMTALLLLERCRPDELIKAPSDVKNIEESSLHLEPGESVTAKEMLYALMLRSANDGCYAVAMHLAGSVKAFAKMMNDRAKELGCTHTCFCNPNGLPNPNHKISPHDLALIAREAMKREDFREAVLQQTHTIVRSTNQSDLLLENKNKWLKMDSTADGIKTGWTVAAGHCYVGSATRDGYRVITVVMKSTDWVTDHKNMLAWSYKFHERRLIAKGGAELAQAPIKGGLSATLPVGPKEDVYRVVRRNAPELAPLTVEEPLEVSAPVMVGDTVGYAETRDDKGLKIRVPLVARVDVSARPVQSGFGSISSVFGTAGVVVVLGGGALVMRRKSSKMSREFSKVGAPKAQEPKA